jgi:NAD(P)-dependent dehydrogenase (short-subunit alcohol dehydrogenase family)
MMRAMAPLELQPTSGVVITGGASGIGLATAHAVAEAGRPVAIWDLHPERSAEAAEAVAGAHGVQTVGMGVDVRDTAALSDAADQAVAAIGTIGGVVHAAGVPDAVDLPDLTDKTWDPLIEVNLRAYAMMVQAFLPQLRANAPDAAVVGIASIHGIVANPANPAYAASKAGVLGLTRSMAIRFAQEGIRVNAICPGFIETPMLPDIGDLHDRFAAASPMHRLGKPSEIGKTARFLLSTDASFITGTQVVVDGGTTITDM